MLIEDERSLEGLVNRLCGGEVIGYFGRRVGKSIGRFKRREKVEWGWFSGSQVRGVGEVRSGQAVRMEMLSMPSTISSAVRVTNAIQISGLVNHSKPAPFSC